MYRITRTLTLVTRHLSLFATCIGLISSTSPELPIPEIVARLKALSLPRVVWTVEVFPFIGTYVINDIFL